MKIEIREDKIILDGYVNVVSRDSRILPSSQGKFIEQIVPKTFERALSKADNVDLLFNHKNDRKLGSTKQGNLELYEDNIGLRAKCEVSDKEVIARAKEGKLSGWSFGFISLKDKWEDTKDNIKRRFVEEMELLEVSILDKTPAYFATSIESRGGDSMVVERRIEDFEFPKKEEEEVVADTKVAEDKVVAKEEDKEVIVEEEKANTDQEVVVDEEVIDEANEEDEAKTIENIINRLAMVEEELDLLKMKAGN